MALFRPGPAIGGISGNLGGANFVISAQRPIVRQRQTRRPPTSQAASLQQARVQSVTVAWAALSSANVKAWNTLAASLRWPDRIGQGRQPTGRQVFFHVNLVRALASLALITTPTPDYGVAPAPYLFGPTAGAGNQLAGEIFYRDGIGTPAWILLYGAPLLSKAPRKKYPSLRYLDKVQVGSGGTSGFTAYNLEPAFTAIWPKPVAGDYFALAGRLVWTLQLPSAFLRTQIAMT